MENKTIEKTLILLSLFCISALSSAQNSSVKKAADAVFTLSTFKADGTLIATTNGVFLENDGTAVSPWVPFAGAEHAIVIDSKGNKHNVETMIGANEIYDLAKFTVSGKIPSALQPISQRPTSGSSVWVVPNQKSKSPLQASINNIETFMDKYAYYILSSNADDLQKGCPVVDTNGKLIGIFSSSVTSQSTTDIQLAVNFSVSGISQNDPVLRQTKIRTALPKDMQQAQLALMLAAEHEQSKYEATTDDFIRSFPNLNDGYYAKALITADKQAPNDGIKILQDAILNVDNKAEANNNLARFLCLVSANAKTTEEKKELLDKALDASKKAQSFSSEPTYKQQEAQIHFDKGDYQVAYDQFIELAEHKQLVGESFYHAALAKEQLGGEDKDIHDLLNKAVEACDTPYTIVAAPYILARGIQRDKMKDYRNAMTDFYIYEAIMYGKVGAPFYFMRGQSEARGKIYQPALNDIAHAIALDPRNTQYWAELASLNLRVRKLPEAIKSAQQCIMLDPEISEAYLILGIAQVESGLKNEGISNMEKAKQLGNEQADTFLVKYK